jgi:hypothetical protein
LGSRISRAANLGVSASLLPQARYRCAKMMSREHQRQFMRSHGFAFCDDQQQRIKDIVEEYQPVREVWEHHSNRYQSLIVEGVEASSTDDPAQSIGTHS